MVSLECTWYVTSTCVSSLTVMKQCWMQLHPQRTISLYLNMMVFYEVLVQHIEVQVFSYSVHIYRLTCSGLVWGQASVYAHLQILK